MKTAYIGVGANLGDKRANCLKALDLMTGIPNSRITGCSEWYLTKPVGVTEQDWYVNGVVGLSTDLSAREVLEHLLAIEKIMGRIRKKRWEARIIDLDILLFGEDIISEDDLTVPHPLMHERGFVLIPIVELAPKLRHPALGLTMAELLQQLPKDGQTVLPQKEL